MITATVEYGVCGYMMSNETFTAQTITDLIASINLKTRELSNQLAAADEKNGDLRGYCPEFGNGYPSLGGMEPEFGEGEFDGCLIDLAANGKEIGYNTKSHAAIRRKAYLD